MKNAQKKVACALARRFQEHMKTDFWKRNMKAFCWILLCWLLLTKIYQYKWYLKAFGDFDHAGMFQEPVICLHLKMSPTLVMKSWMHRNLWTVIELQSSQDWPLLPCTICDGVEKNCSSKQSVKHARVLISHSVKLCIKFGLKQCRWIKLRGSSICQIPFLTTTIYWPLIS